MIDKEFIMEQKEIIIDNLKEYSKASDKEIEQFTKLIEQKDPEIWFWRCGVELVPIFETMRKQNSFFKKQTSNFNKII